MHFSTGQFIIVNGYGRMLVVKHITQGESSARFVVGRGRGCSDGCGLHSFEVLFLASGNEIEQKLFKSVSTNVKKSREG